MQQETHLHNASRRKPTISREMSLSMMIPKGTNGCNIDSELQARSKPLHQNRNLQRMGLAPMGSYLSNRPYRHEQRQEY
jgi:hypothetical protein